MVLTPQEMETAQKVLGNLRSNKYKDKNYLFLLPFDLKEAPGYLDVVDKKLDLHTVSELLRSGAYGTMAEFWDDTAAIFENAIKYHSSRAGNSTKWIVPVARNMLKALNKERKNAEGGGGGGGKKSLKIKLPKQQQSSAASSNQLPSGAQSAAAAGTVDAPAAVTSATVSSAAPTAKKATLKLKLPTQQKKATSKANSKKAVKAKPTQPKLKLKLSTKGPSAASSRGKVIKKEDAASSGSKETKGNKSGSTTKKPKITLKLGNSRGKELPKGIAAQKASAAKSKSSSAETKTAAGSGVGGGAAPDPATSAAATTTTTPSSTISKTKKTKKEKTTKATAKTTAVGATAKSTAKTTTKTTAKSKEKLAFPTAQASKVLCGLKRRQSKSMSWFLQPVYVSEKSIAADYKAKVKHPMDISTMTNKLEKGSYHTVNAFVLDLRRIFSNCLIFNTSIKDSLRPVAVEVLETAEDLLKAFFVGYNTYPKLLYCWKLCVNVLDTLYNLVNPTDGQPTALYFLQPVSFYCGGQFPADYLEKVSKPMDFSTVTTNLLTARYHAVEDFGRDCRLVLSNCLAYYSGRDDGKIYIDQANRLSEVLNRSLEQLARYVKSPRGSADSARAAAPVILPHPPAQLLLTVLEDMRALKYTDKATRTTEEAMKPFERPVDTSIYQDYMQYVQHPMDLSTVERKVKANAYATPEDFEYDVNLIFKNCEVYNSKRNVHHLVQLAKFGARQFKKIFYANMRAFEDPASMPPPKVERHDSTPEKSGSDKPGSKKITIDTSAVAKSKAPPRISITAAQVSSAALNAARAKSPSTQKNKIAQQQQQIQKRNQPIPLHIAIARVKEAFPLRRAHKSLQPFEADCARYFKELMRHPWISAARPKFIFHVPVPILFPDLREVYSAKIRKPMDLTTVECTLLAGNRYASPEDFLQDIALVFANAIEFNRDGRDIGDPLSCAYYDASVHLLRYSRWLSFEIFSRYVDVTSEYVDEGGADGLPPFSWKLTNGNKKRSREEMEKIVLNEPIDRSLEGDRWTWHEAECEKLLKALRHQSDFRHMSFYIQPNYPPDYTAFISKPMDWEKVQKTLKKRQYDKFGDVVADLRLIFSNALKYNARLKGVDAVSGQAYEAAEHMSAKLEVSINKLLLSVSDRLERERIDHANAEREIEAAERAEEDRIKEAWKKEPNKEKSDVMPSSRRDSVKIRLGRRAAQQARESADLEIPFFDEEDDGQHERSYFEFVKFQKSMFEKQRQELTKMRQCASALGALVYSRLLQRTLAEQWVEQERSKLPTRAMVDAGAHQDQGGDQASEKEAVAEGEGAKEVHANNNGPNKPSTVLSKLEQEGRGPIQIKLALGSKEKKGKGTKRKRPAFSFD